MTSHADDIRAGFTKPAGDKVDAMRKIVVFNNMAARVTLEGDVDHVQDGPYTARGRIKLVVNAKAMAKERFVRKYYESLFGSEDSYEEAREANGEGFLNDIDDMLPDLGKPTIRVHSKTLCEWKDPSFTISHYDDVWNDAGMECGEDSAEAARMCLGSGGSSLEVALDMTELAKTIEALFLAGSLESIPSIDLMIGVFLDFQAAQSEGTWFKTVSFGMKLEPALLSTQAIILDAATRRYRLIAGPTAGAVRFVTRPTVHVSLMPDPVAAPAECTSALVTWDGSGLPELLALGPNGDMSFAYKAILYAQHAYHCLHVTPDEDKPFELTLDTIADFDAMAMKAGDDGTMVPASDAVVTVEPPSERDLWAAVVVGEAHHRHVVLSIDQVRGARAARNDSKALLKSPEDYVLRRIEALRVKLVVGTFELTRTLLVGITLPRWFALEGRDEETHLRTNYATVMQGLRDAITRYNGAHAIPAHFNVVARDGFDKITAGNFLFRHDASDAIAERYFFTRADEVDQNCETACDWLNTMWGCPRPAERPPKLTEAALLVRMIELREAKGDKLTPGDVFGVGLEETGGDIGAALLISHNTLRSLARDCGDSIRTGIEALDKDRFDKLFITIRGGYRCSDGFAGARKDATCAESNFAGDNAGPWYHLFGTAYYETYTATPGDSTPSDNRWARTANVLEQWYREYCPTSWQDPDPEKEYVNRWGIAAADELLTEQPWLGD